jgi:hypothetical protein
MTGSFPRRCSGRTVGVLGLALAQAGCGAGWRRTAELSPGVLPPGQQAEAWRGGRVERLHAVIITDCRLAQRRPVPAPPRLRHLSGRAPPGRGGFGAPWASRARVLEGRRRDPWRGRGAGIRSVRPEPRGRLPVG